MEHYFNKTPVSALNETLIERTIGDVKLHFYTGSGVFSRNGIDFGSQLLIESFLNDFDDADKIILDLGCGYGPIGIFAAEKFRSAHVEMTDINERAVKLARENIDSNKIKNIDVFVSDGFSAIKRKYDAIVTNPPIRAGKKTVFSFYEGAFQHLKNNGLFYCVIQKKQGAESSFDKLEKLFGNCETINRKSGYRVLKSIK